MDNGTVEEPKLQPAEEDVSCLKELEGNLPPEKKPRYPNQGVPDLAPTFPNRKEALKNVSYNQFLLKDFQGVYCTL